jgi:YD repeat-containing protein
VQASNALGESIQYAYKAGQLSKVTHADMTEERFERDAEGRLLAHVDALDRCTTWSYTRAGLLAERVDALEHKLRYRWDKLGRLVSLENQNGSRASFVLRPGRAPSGGNRFRWFDHALPVRPEQRSAGEHQVGQRRVDHALRCMGRLIERTPAWVISSRAKPSPTMATATAPGPMPSASCSGSMMTPAT